MKIACIVEGDGEGRALPALLHRLHQRFSPNTPPPLIEPPIRVRRDQFLNKPEEFSRHLQLAALKCGQDGRILILLDADDDCPKILADKIVQGARKIVPHHPVSVVLANREYEAWFIASATALQASGDFVITTREKIPAAEGLRDAKGWVKQHMPNRVYGETIEQLALTRQMDLEQACKNSRSFRKLCGEWEKWMRP